MAQPALHTFCNRKARGHLYDTIYMWLVINSALAKKVSCLIVVDTVSDTLAMLPHHDNRTFLIKSVRVGELVLVVIAYQTERGGEERKGKEREIEESGRKGERRRGKEKKGKKRGMEERRGKERK